MTASPNPLSTTPGQAQLPGAVVDRNILGMNLKNIMQTKIQQGAQQASGALWTGIVPRLFSAGCQ